MIRELVEGIDLMPTILDVTALPIPESLQGESILPVILGDRGKEEPKAFAETTTCGYQCREDTPLSKLTSVRTPMWKLIERMDPQHPSGPAYELYHLPSDPTEAENVVGTNGDVVSRLKETLKVWKDGNEILSERLITAQSKGDAMGKASLGAFPGELALNYRLQGTRIVAYWNGGPGATYTVEYDVGRGVYHLVGTFTLEGNRKAFGPFPADFWEALKKYEPMRFRVSYAGDPSTWSPWKTLFRNNQKWTACDNHK